MVFLLFMLIFCVRSFNFMLIVRWGLVEVSLGQRLVWDELNKGFD